MAGEAQAQMQDEEMLSFKIIAAVGSARSCYIEAIHAARDGDFVRAAESIEQGRKEFLAGHAVHSTLLQRMASGVDVNMNMLLTHAEDQLMSAEGFGILAEEFVSVYQRIYEKQA
ncbi:PTS lactose/cellobiose transporter subunit IIA [Olsenella massiliensis]|uniref:PTS lactose/cellobiose transporter subunit IIA n=1 Tax=Olsenella massiliensis TaxID=1622075 RepID=UPI000B2D951C|nr:PTS lactose/cellobiose transporter subunit IIA [Olsenella massiliensis]